MHMSYATVAVLQQQNSEPAGWGHMVLAFASTMFRCDETPLASAELQSALVEVRLSTAGIERRHALSRRFSYVGRVRFPEPWGHMVDLD